MNTDRTSHDLVALAVAIVGMIAVFWLYTWAVLNTFKTSAPSSDCKIEGKAS